jgi:hypothetical protein
VPLINSTGVLIGRRGAYIKYTENRSCEDTARCSHMQAKETGRVHQKSTLWHLDLQNCVKMNFCRLSRTVTLTSSFVMQPLQTDTKAFPATKLSWVWFLLLKGPATLPYLARQSLQASLEMLPPHTDLLWTQGFALAGQVLYHLSYTFSPEKDLIYLIKTLLQQKLLSAE